MRIGFCAGLLPLVFSSVTEVVNTSGILRSKKLSLLQQLQRDRRHADDEVANFLAGADFTATKVNGFCDGAKTVDECRASKAVCKASCDEQTSRCKNEEERCRAGIGACKDRKRQCKDRCGGNWRERRRCRRSCDHANSCGSRNDCNRPCGRDGRKCKRACPSPLACKIKGAICETLGRAKEALFRTGPGSFLTAAAISSTQMQNKAKYGSLFPEPNGVYGSEGSEYKANAELKSMTRYQLAVTLAGYDFSSSTGEEHGSNFAAVSPGVTADPAKFCGLGSDKANKQYVAQATWSVKKGTHDVQMSTYLYEDDKQIIVTANFRGSEVPSFETPKANVMQSLSALRDWVGTDFVLWPSEDKICGNQDMQMQQGFLHAYLSMRDSGKNKDGDNWVANVKKLLAAAKKEAGGKKAVKLYLSGHSMGGAIAAIATYDVWCNKLFHEDLGYAEEESEFKSGPFTITYGEAYPMYGASSIDVYSELVPKTNRLRVNTCGQRGVVFGGDIVGMVTNFVDDSNFGWRHTSDGDFQCGWVSRTGGDSGCVGGLYSGLCHLLDRYLEGTMNQCATDTLGSADKCGQERNDMSGFCQGPVPVGPKHKMEPPKMWFVEPFKWAAAQGTAAWKILENPVDFFNSQKGGLMARFQREE